MDHIPSAREAEDIEIMPERTGLCSWDADDFLLYEPSYDKGVGKRDEIMLSVIQEWLFLGVLEQFSEIFELPIDLSHSKMVDESGIEQRTSQNLPPFFGRLAIKYGSGDVSVGSSSMPAEDLMLSEPSSGPLEATSRLESAAACFEASTSFLNDLWEWARRFPRIRIEHADVRCCYAFVEALSDWVDRFLTNGKRSSWNPNRSHGPVLKPNFSETLINSGWCPSRFGRSASLSESAVYRLSLLPGCDTPSHANNTSSRCEYVLCRVLPQMPFHETSACAGICECRKLEGPENQLVEPMNTGSFPVLRYNMENARPQLAEL
jgi:hypothetical protein